MKKLFVILIILFMLLSCGIDDNDGNSCRNIVPVITDVVFFTCGSPDFNPDHDNIMNVSDEFDVIIYATDCNLDMETLYSDLGDYPLPDQIGVDRGYHFENCFIVDDVPPGIYIVEFWIEDREGYISNIFEVPITVK